MKIEVHHYHHVSTDGDVLTVVASLASQLTALTALVTKGFQMAEHTLQEIADDVVRETTVSQGISTMVTGLVAKIGNTVPGLTDEQKAQINAIGDGMTQNLAVFQAALAAGTAGLNGTPADTPVPPVVDPANPA